VSLRDYLLNLLSECGPPPILIDGTYNPVQNYYFADQTITYMCTSNVLVGIDTNTCQDDGTWSNPAPVCSNQGKPQVFCSFLFVYLSSCFCQGTTEPFRSLNQAATCYYQSNHSKVEVIPLSALHKDTTSELAGISPHYPF